MTQKEKAKAYDEVVGKLKVFMTQGVDPLITRADVQDFFPELKESERERDERIRKALLDYFGECEKLDINPVHDAQTNTILAWLEKATITQKDFAPKDKCAGCNNIKGCMTCVDGDNWAHYYYEDEQKTTDKVEPKSEIIKDTWYICTCTTCSEDSRIWFKKDMAYLGNDILKYDLGLEPDDYQDYFRLWTIQDAKDGDVLTRNNDILSICIFSHFDGINNKFSSFLCHCGLEGERLGQELSINGYHDDSKNYVPATKEQRDLLFQKMKEAGYEWDSEKKELKIIDWSKHIKYEPNSPSIIEEKPAWSEEDDAYKEFAICAVEDYYGEENPLHTCIVNWLKSLKERCAWKPSEEQIEAIRLARSFVTDDFDDNPTLSEILVELEKQLKKIK